MKRFELDEALISGMTRRPFVNFRPYGKGERYAEQFRLLHGEPSKPVPVAEYLLVALGVILILAGVVI